MINGKKVIVVFPAYNASRTLVKTFNEVPKGWVDGFVLVDDFSTDDTVAVARRLPIKVIQHPFNLGYGANQKTCYLQALEDGADIIIMLHPDYQYDPKVIPALIEPIASGQARVVFASRMLGGGALRGGMPPYKFLFNKVLTYLENLLLGTQYTEFHTGYRAYERGVLKSIPFLRNSNDFVFDSEMILQIVNKGVHIHEIPIPTMYHSDASSVNFVTSTVYGTKTLIAIGKYLLNRYGLRSCALFE
ncbi:MAG: glycosyltransferase family 2 protein [Planctomycetes bacterium]|nr:glycosyltransferase family 2 protein [Planctomycetota bacterium]